MRLRVLLLTVAALAVAGEARAQLFWDAPTFMPPRPGDDIGVYIADGDHTDVGVQGIWRQQGNLNLGLRLGFVDAEPDDGRVLVGIETWDGIISAGPEFPLDINWTLGAGATFGDWTLFSVPVGLSLGRTFISESLAFQLYGHPRLALAVYADDANDETELEGLFDLGGEVHLGPSWKVRLAFTLGDYDAFGLGVAYRFGRQVVVR